MEYSRKLEVREGARETLGCYFLVGGLDGGSIETHLHPPLSLPSQPTPSLATYHLTLIWPRIVWEIYIVECNYDDRG